MGFFKSIPLQSSNFLWWLLLCSQLPFNFVNFCIPCFLWVNWSRFLPGLFVFSKNCIFYILILSVVFFVLILWLFSDFWFWGLYILFGLCFVLFSNSWIVSLSELFVFHNFIMQACRAIKFPHRHSLMYIISFLAVLSFSLNSRNYFFLSFFLFLIHISGTWLWIYLNLHNFMFVFFSFKFHCTVGS